ncbi:MAG TPA: multicopper oxidase domain-containing protein, partial [Deltaproteobacteria bacterium]|nr:multicopper oxidase domain-containing protein [Deltaproteobacteria bacterium]
MKPLVKCLKNHSWSFLLMAIMFIPLTAQSQVVCPPGSVPDPNNPDTICVLDAATHPKFVNICPNPLDPSFIWNPTTPGGSHYEIGAYQFQQSLGLVNPATGTPLTTTVWGYGSATQAPTYPGRTFLIDKGSASSKPITVKWYNNLVDEADNPLPHLLPVDSTLDWADPFFDPPNRVPGPYLGPVPICMHLHGGHTESLSDGLPDAWFTPGYAQTGRLFNMTYTYPMDQEAATIWYHDHALGITRLNVYAGLAGFCLIRDANEASLKLPKFPYEIPLVIQDRMFTPDGQLYYPTQPSVLPGDAPSAQPEMFGDFILVNGK